MTKITCVHHCWVGVTADHVYQIPLTRIRKQKPSKPKKKRSQGPTTELGSLSLNDDPLPTKARKRDKPKSLRLSIPSSISTNTTVTPLSAAKPTKLAEHNHAEKAKEKTTFKPKPLSKRNTNATTSSPPPSHVSPTDSPINFNNRKKYEGVKFQKKSAVSDTGETQADIVDSPMDVDDNEVQSTPAWRTPSPSPSSSPTRSPDLVARTPSQVRSPILAPVQQHSPPPTPDAVYKTMTSHNAPPSPPQSPVSFSRHVRNGSDDCRQSQNQRHHQTRLDTCDDGFDNDNAVLQQQDDADAWVLSFFV